MEVEGGKTYYEVESINGKESLDAEYLADGTVAEVEEGPATSDLPAPVKAAVTAKYPKGKIVKSEKTTRGDAITYEIKVTSGKTKAGMVVDPIGKIVKEKNAGAKEKESEGKN